MRQGLERLYSAVEGLSAAKPMWGDYQDRFNAAMQDDFNTPEAMAVLFEMSREVNRLKEANELDKAAGIAAAMIELGQLLGVLRESPENFLKGDVAESDAAKIDALLQEREQARKDKNWARADEIRDQLAADGVAILDTADGTTWRKG